MNLLLGSLTIGLIMSLLALGVYISFRLFDFADITVDGSITLGAAVAAVLLIRGVNPALATLAGAGAGFIAGSITGILHTRFHIHSLLSGILVMTALYSINLRIMGRSNVSLVSTPNVTGYAARLGEKISGGSAALRLLGWEVAPTDVAVLVCAFLAVVFVAAALHWFFRTQIGTAMRATGDNAQMVRALGANTGNMIILGLGLSNALAATSGALLAQYQGFADAQMGIGMIVWGLASVIIGETLVKTRRLALAVPGVIVGAILFRLLVAIALRFGLNPNDLKLLTAVFVLGALVLPRFLARFSARKGAKEHA
jgi:putative ABC transport system permease protein